MTEEQIIKIVRDELSTFIKSDKYVFEKLSQVLDGKNFQFGRTTGTKLGTATDQKIGFYGKTPIVQSGVIADPSGGATQDAEARSAISSILTVLRNLGIINT